MVKQPILTELEYFIKGATTIAQLSPSALGHLVQSGLSLLQNLPAAKDAVFEYFSVYFDASVAAYIQFLEKDSNAIDPNESSIFQIQNALEKLVTEGQPAWSPHISAWSLRTLGILSKKYNRFENKDIGSISNIWLSSSPMRCLLELTVSCFERLQSHEEQAFIECLMNTYMQNSPHFDWVIARLGSCFPQKIINKMLYNGLKIMAEKRTIGHDSEINVLTYLACVQEKDIKKLLRVLLVQSIYENPNHKQPELSIVPYLLNMCTKSEPLLRQIVAVFLDIYDDRFVPALVAQVKLWQIPIDQNELMKTLTSLILRIREGSTRVLLTLAQISENNAWSHDLLESILQEVFHMLTEDRTSSILVDALNDSSRKVLIERSIHGTFIERQTAIRLVLLAANQSQQLYQDVISGLLASSTMPLKSSANLPLEIESLIRLMSNMNGTLEPLSIAPGINQALERMLIDEGKLDEDIVERNLTILKNLHTLVNLEKNHSSSSPHLKEIQVTAATEECLKTLIEIGSHYLAKSMESIASASKINSNANQKEPPTKKPKPIEQLPSIRMSCTYSNAHKSHIHALMSLLNLLEAGKKDEILAMDTCIRLAEIFVKYFFWSLAEVDDDVLRLVSVDRAIVLLERICSSRRYARSAALRELLEGALFSFGNLFGMQNEIEFDACIKPKKSTEQLLIKANQMHNNTPNNIRSTLHAGVIGHGLKIPAKEAAEPDADTRNFFLRAIMACCKQDDHQGTADGFTALSLLLVEMVSPDVMYNGMPWPEEEFNRITMERDLQIRRTMKNAPILWSLLALIAMYRPSLCFASVLLRAICASLLHQWRAKSVLHNQTIHNNQDLFKETKKLLEIMALGQLLPIPFSYLHAVIEHFEPFEIAVVLKECVWNYMKENIPSPMTFSIAPNGLYWRNWTSSKPHAQLIDPLRNIMQRKLSKLGTLYHYMFVLPEMNKLKV